LGGLWLHEGYVKYDAHFGQADIGLIVDGATSNSRIPPYFSVVAEHVLHPASALFGAVIPLLETSLGLALLLGLVTLPAAMVSLVTLLTYWSSDQLISQYPVMAALSAAVIAWPAAASRFSVTSLLLQRLRRRRPERSWVSASSARRWL
jgi:thiosulfate dehydrogenase [quinone] large subunit